MPHRGAHLDSGCGNNSNIGGATSTKNGTKRLCGGDGGALDDEDGDDDVLLLLGVGGVGGGHAPVKEEEEEEVLVDDHVRRSPQKELFVAKLSIVLLLASPQKDSETDWIYGARKFLKAPREQLWAKCCCCGPMDR